MWTATSPNLTHWGEHKFLMGVEEGWQSLKIGGGAVPFKTDKGWIEIYHGTDRNNRYTLGCNMAVVHSVKKRGVRQSYCFHRKS
jgi:beta-1,2-mannobiose phosphorylase / 1,2-beta-oligomannan phosphorylase